MTNQAAVAPFACDPDASRGRRHDEPESASRTAFQRDRDRIIHCGAFRRLMYKTQVFVNHEGDYYRTRLTHTLEVAQIARSVARALGLNEDLAEALALAHDLGHPPFGHAGEDALAEIAAPHGGFDHNAQTLRILTRLESRYAEFDGLNLCWETIEGVLKHNGPIAGDAGVPRVVHEIAARHDIDPALQASAEAQVAALADDIAYNNHDIDDGVRAGLFAVEDLATVPLAGPVFAEVRERYPDLAPSRLIHELVRRMIDRMVNDLLAETRQRIEAAAALSSADAVRALDRPLVAFSETMAANDRALKAFLFERMYRHYKINRMAIKARRVVRDLFELYIAEPDCLPDDWRAAADGAGTSGTARLVADYIAGMTDRYALDEHKRLFNMYASVV